jgi:FtsH-binding integral membrane protein
MPQTAYRTDGLRQTVAVDNQLRSYLLKVYALVGGGLAVSGGVAALIASTGVHDAFVAQGPGRHQHLTVLGSLFQFLPLLLMFAAFMMRTARVPKAATAFVYWLFTASFGVGLSLFVGKYGYGQLALPFLMTSVTFLVLCLFGYTTKSDLTGVGHFMIIGLFMMLVLAFSAMIFGFGINHTVFSAVGIVIFLGLTAYDSQKIKIDFLQSRDDSYGAASWAAMSLYLDFLNLFSFITDLAKNND